MVLLLDVSSLLIDIAFRTGDLVRLEMTFFLQYFSIGGIALHIQDIEV